MAAISGLPNFFVSAKPASADFNNAAKAILSQLGGTYYDEGSVAIVSASGNLDSNNIASGAWFINSQKAESSNIGCLTAYSMTRAGEVAINPPQLSPTPNHAILGSVAVPIKLLSLSVMASSSASTYGVVGGYVDLYLNNAILTSVSFNDNSTNNSAANEYVVAKLPSLQLAPNDFLIVDFTYLNPFGTGGTWSNPSCSVTFGLMYSAQHVE